MTDFEWCKAICKVDEEGVRRWIEEHRHESVFSRPISTKRDNYGAVGVKSVRSVNHFEVGRRIDGGQP